jgi:hypothetical protein
MAAQAQVEQNSTHNGSQMGGKAGGELVSTLSLILTSLISFLF